MKFIARTVVLLLVINGLLLYMHFSQAGRASGEDINARTYSQEIEVTNRPDALHIRHHFRGLTNGRYEIVWPEVSTERSCYGIAETECSRLEEKMTALIEGEVDQQSISYVIPKNEPMGDSYLFKMPFVELHGVGVRSTILHLTDETGIGGFWVNGLEQKGQKSLELIDYALFRGSGKISDLYWQKDMLPLEYAGERLTVYGAVANLKALEEADAALKSVDAEHSIVVIDKEKSALRSKRFVVTDTVDAARIADRFMIDSMFSRFEIPNSQYIIAESVASVLIGTGIGSEKSQSLYDELTTVITPNELELFVQKLRTKTGEPVDAEILDDLIVQVTGFGTSYFSENNNDEKHVYPFLFEDAREVLVSGESHPDIKVIIKDGKTLYPIEEVLSQSGYDIRKNDRSIYIENEARKFRFPLKEPFYVYNERKFDLVSVPFDLIDDQLYFEESWFIRLFLFDIEKKSETINLVPKTQFPNEGAVK
ncbi:hypothetical protein ACFSFY_13140 [Sporosarcina siberiensis]|uniref:Two-component signal transduction system YycFG, regulatory protein YycH n=1 Tax=Sporosarcina siberiensis TaxID=1365606 RepID=A0ABW4SHS3_9BACL